MVTTPVEIDEAVLNERRDRVFLALAGTFLCAMTLLNVVGITRFIQLGPMSLAVGVLPYPLTFLCTDLICELYGRRRANYMVTVGLCLNFFILGVLYLGNIMPAVAADTQPPWQTLQLANDVMLPNGEIATGSVEFFDLIYATTSGAVVASMMAYIAAQYADVKLFHFWKRITKGKHLWIRNNFSTLISQMVDSFMVITVTFGASLIDGRLGLAAFFTLMFSNYLFKMMAALMDTLPFYFLVKKLSLYLQIDTMKVD